MKIFQRTVATSLLLAFVAGCEPGPPNLRPGPETPHGGSLFPLPDGQGYVEILKQTTSGRKPRTRIVAYFLDTDRKTLAAIPIAVSLKLQAGGTAPVEFRSTSDPDPAKAGGLTSALIPDRDDLGGDLSAMIDGKSVTIPISLR
jgi:hypothetical protein